MAGTRPDPRARQPVDDLRADDVPDLDELPDRLDVPLEKPVEDVIESLQSAGDDNDEYEPHA